MPVKGILRQAAVLIALVSALGTAAAFMRMARHSVLVVTDEYGVVVRCGFIDHILLRKHIYHIPIKATTAQQVRINPTHILVFLWEHKWFGRLPLDRRRQRQRSSAAAQQKFDRLRIAFAHEAAHKINARLAITLPAAPFWEGEESFNFIFGLAPRIAIASLLAFLLGSFLNAYIMSKMKVATQGKYFSLRAILSTIAGESADSLLFFPLAFGGLIPVQALLVMIATQALLKSLYEVIILPVTIRVVKYIKKIDQTDVYDKDISYNIIKIKDL